MAKQFLYDSYSVEIIKVQSGTWSYLLKRDEITTTHTAFDLFSDSFAVDDYIIFSNLHGGSSRTNPSGGFAWNKLTLNIETAIAATSFDGVWEYYGYDIDGSGSATWRTLTCTDNTNKFQNTGLQTVEFDYPIYHAGAVQIGSYRIDPAIRFRITSVSDPTEGGRIAANSVLRQIYGIKVENETVTPASLYSWQLGAGYNIMTKTMSGIRDTYQLNCSLLICAGAKLLILNTNLTIGDIGYQQYALGTWEKATVASESDTGIIQIGEPYSTGLPTGIGNSKNGGILILNQAYLSVYGSNNMLGIVRCYGSVIDKPSGGESDGGSFGPYEITFVDSMFINKNGRSSLSADSIVFQNNSLYNFTYSSNGLWYVYCDIQHSDDIKIINSCPGMLCGVTVSVRGVVFRSGQIIQRHYDANVTLTNCVLPNTSNLTSRELTNGYTRWIKHYFTYNIKVLDETGTPIEGATIKVVNKDNTQEFTTTTDANGLITEQKVLQYYKEWTKTGEAGEPNGGTLMVDEDYNPFTMTISKTGYETYVSEDTLTTELKTTITLKKAVPILLSDKGQVFLKKNKENQGSGRSLIFNL